MKIELGKNVCIVTRELHDSAYYGTVNAAGESRFLHAVKTKLNADLGLGLIKKRMWKDGHMVDDMQQYLRNKNGSLAIYNCDWAIEGANDAFNRGQVRLAVIDLTI